MNAKKTPLEQVNEDHGGKAKLVDSVLGMIDIGDEDKDAARARLLKASNRKLLRLRANSTAIKEKFSTVDKLVYAVAEKIGRVKDSDFVKRLEGWSPAKLLDHARSLTGEPRRPVKAVAGRVVKPAEKKEKAPAKKAAAKKQVKPPSKKAAAKKASSKKAAAIKKKTAKK
jgi:hypothetical protein